LAHVEGKQNEPDNDLETRFFLEIPSEDETEKYGHTKSCNEDPGDFVNPLPILGFEPVTQ
jgi:hypothetical protein